MHWPFFLLETPPIPFDWFDVLITRFGLPLAELMGVIVLIVRRMLVPGYAYDDALKQRDRALDAAERIAEAGEIAARVAEKVVPRADRS